MNDLNAQRANGLFSILETTTAIRRDELAAALVKAHGSTAVMSGPFAGMALPLAKSWGEGDFGSKLLGCYEAELHPAIDEAIARAPQVVINIGCAEGYYAIGLARALPSARIFAFDIDSKAKAVCRQAADANGVGERVVVDGACYFDKLRKTIGKEGRTLLVVDCEGGELALLNPAMVPELARCDIIVECHDFLDRSTTETLRRRFAASHDVVDVVEGARDPNQFPLLRSMLSLDRWLIVHEGRPETMNWLVCWPKSVS